MIQLKPEVFAKLDGSLAGVQASVQLAIELEHSTIPPYLYALYSIKPGTNAAVYKIIFSIVMEEMLHMAGACNLLNALAGAPVIDTPKFVPNYPCPLPGSVEDQLIVHLAPLSIKHITDTFLVIEQPENPLIFPEIKLAKAKGPTTIGDFYRTIRDQLKAEWFTGDPKKQVGGGFPVVTDLQSAYAAIDLIVTQGEGTSKSPEDAEHNPAHWYRFNEIVKGHLLIKNPNPPPNPTPEQQYCYGGALVVLDSNGILPIITNPKSAKYPAGSAARVANDTFNYTYTGMLKALHKTFNGDPENLSTAIGLMESLKEQVAALTAIPLKAGGNAGPSFEYQPVNPSS